MSRHTAIVASALLLIAAVGLATLPATGAQAAQKELGKKFVFENVNFPDGTTGTIFASIRITRQKMMAVASYFDEDDGYIGQYREYNGFTSDDPDAVRAWALSHYGDRK